MQDAYVQAFVQLATSAREETGIELPAHIEHYVVCLLAVHVDKTDFLPKHTFAHSLLMICTSDVAHFKHSRTITNITGD